MKKVLSTISILTTALAIAVFVLMPVEVRAAGFLDGAVISVINSVFATMGNVIQGFFSIILYFSGMILNFSINITLNIKDLYDSTPAIGNVWIILRNLSSIFIIFILLAASIETILGVGKTNIKNLIGSVIIAGLVINFSLFFTKVVVDASNLVSMQFYNAITPKGVGADGGISAVFMNSLKIQKIYNPSYSGIKGETDNGSIMASIILATYGGSILMLFASISFIGAAAAFAFRTAILLFLMAFSPLYVAGMIFPKIKSEVSDLWMKTLVSQLIFMPAYLLLMYVALTVISDNGFMSFLQSSDGVSTGNWYNKLAGVVMQYFIAIIFINIPLIAAIKLGGEGTKLATSFASGMNKSLISKIKSQPAAAWRNTAGSLASKAAESNKIKNYAAKSPLAAGALKGLRNVAKSYNETEKKVADEKAKFGESLGHNESKVNEIETENAKHKNEIDKLSIQINDPRAPLSVIGTAKDEKEKLEKKIKENNIKISEEKRSRQIAYAERLDPRDMDEKTGKLKPTSLWQRVTKGKGYISRNEELASSQIHIKNLESELEQLNKKLEEKKKEQDKLKTSIERLDNKEKTKEGLEDAEKELRKELKNKLYKLIVDPTVDSSGQTVNGEEGINGISKAIRDTDLELKRYKKLS